MEERLFDRSDVDAIFAALLDIRGLLVQLVELLGEDDGGAEEENEP